MSAVHWNLAMLQREWFTHAFSLTEAHTHKVHMNNNTHSHTHPETTLKGTSCKNNASVWVLFMWISHVWLVIPDTAVAYVSRIPSEYVWMTLPRAKTEYYGPNCTEEQHIYKQSSRRHQQETHVNHSRPVNELETNMWWGLFKLLFLCDVTSTAMLKLRATFCAMCQSNPCGLL